MASLKTVLFYILGLAGLILISVLFTGQVEVEIRELPTPTPVSRVTPTATPPLISQTGCTPMPKGRANGYLPGAPITTTLAPPDLPGERLVISGTVYASDCVTPLPGALVEVWQADANGNYDRSEPFILRAQMRTDAEGRYEFTTIRPGHYGTTDIGRPAHIHYQISYPDDASVVASRMLFADDPYLDASARANSALVVSLTEQEGPNGPILHGTFDIILPVPPPTFTPTPTPLHTPEPQISVDLADELALINPPPGRLMLRNRSYSSNR